MNVHFSSATDNWATPDEYFLKLTRLFNFSLDACADSKNAKSARYFTKEQNALKQSWLCDKGAVFLNPPYGRNISDWVKKAYETAKLGTPVVCLLPARTDTKWWQDYCAGGIVYFLRGRLKFGGQKNSAPFPSALVIFANLDNSSKMKMA
jgi:site-specific DNA-methyltransferase (adenine-specific)